MCVLTNCVCVCVRVCVFVCVFVCVRLCVCVGGGKDMTTWIYLGLLAEGDSCSIGKLPALLRGWLGGLE